MICVNKSTGKKLGFPIDIFPSIFIRQNIIHRIPENGKNSFGYFLVVLGFILIKIRIGKKRRRACIYEQFKVYFVFVFLHLSSHLSSDFCFLLLSIASQVPTKVIKNEELICTREIKLYRQMCCAHRIVQEEKKRRKSCKVKHTHTHEAKRNDLSSEEINTHTSKEREREINEQTG